MKTKTKKYKSARAWMIISHGTPLTCHGLSDSRNSAIDAFMLIQAYGRWSNYKKLGYECKRVVIKVG